MVFKVAAFGLHASVKMS